MKNKDIKNELPLFKSLVLFLKTIKPKIINMQKDMKMTFGNKLFDTIYDAICITKICYNENNNEIKLKTNKKLLYKVYEIEAIVKTLYETEDFNMKTHSQLMLQLGDILLQVNGWKKAIENKCNKDEQLMQNKTY